MRQGVCCRSAHLAIIMSSSTFHSFCISVLATESSLLSLGIFAPRCSSACSRTLSFAVRFSYTTSIRAFSRSTVFTHSSSLDHYTIYKEIFYLPVEPNPPSFLCVIPKSSLEFTIITLKKFKDGWQIWKYRSNADTGKFCILASTISTMAVKGPL